MKKRILLSASVLFITLQTVFAQNVVQNPDFEDYGICPTSVAQIPNLDFWDNLVPHVGSADMLNVCNTGIVNVPANAFGNEAAFSGDGYIGLALMYSAFGGDFREYVVNELACPLEPGIEYNVSFKMSIADAIGGGVWGIQDGVQLHFSTGPPVGDGSALPQFPSLTPQCNPSFTCTSTAGWTDVSASFIAGGGETHMTVGNFYDNISSIPIDGAGTLGPSTAQVYVYIDSMTITPIYVTTWDVPTPVCITDAPIDLDTYITDGTAGTWSGVGMTGSLFDPSAGTQDITYNVDYACGGTATLTQTIVVDAAPALDAGLAVSVCDGETVTLTADNPDGATIGWTGGVVDGVAFVPPLGTTTYYVSGSIGSCSNTDSVDVTVNPIPSIDAGPDVVACEGDLVTLTADNPDGATLAWSGGITDGVGFPALGGITTYTVTATLAGCVATDDVDVNGSGSLTLDAGLDVTVCDGELVTLTAANPDGAALVWTGGVTDGVAFTPPLGSTMYYVTGTIGSCSATDSLTVNVNPAPAIDAGPDQLVCEGTMVTLTAINPDAAVLAWSGGISDGTPFPAAAGATVYTVTATLAGCSSTDDVTIDGSGSIFLNAGPDVSVCEGESVTLTGTNPDGATLVWDLGVTDGIAFTPSLGTTTYTLTGTAGTCIETDDVDVTVHPLPNPSISADITTGCAPLTVNFSDVGGGVSGTVCSWSFGDGSSSSACGSTTHTYDQDGTYSVSLTTTTAEGCSMNTSEANLIVVTPTPTAYFTFTPQVLTVENTEASCTNLSEDAFSYSWDFGDDSPLSSDVNPTHSFPELPGEYIVTLTASNQANTCQDIYQKLIIVEDVIIFYIPNVFTPDGDEYNESWKPVFYSGYDPYDYHLTVLNRWGEIVFESYNAAYGWNGHYGNRGLVEDGTYIWQIEFKETMSDKKHKHRGHVTILK